MHVPEFLGIFYVFEIHFSKLWTELCLFGLNISRKMALAPNIRLLGSLCKNACKVSSARFSVSSPVAGNVTVVTDDKGIATVSMAKAPVNSLNTELIQACHSRLVSVLKNLFRSLLLLLFLLQQLPKAWF